MPTPTTPSATTGGYTIKVATKSGIGDYLVDSRGMTLYYSTSDVIGKSNATAAVLANWPIFNTPDFMVWPTVDRNDFATITRNDAAEQATYKGWPLYYYAKDQAPGDTLGEGVGGTWFVTKVPFYSVMLRTKARRG